MFLYVRFSETMNAETEMTALPTNDFFDDAESNIITSELAGAKGKKFIAQMRLNKVTTQKLL